MSVAACAALVERGDPERFLATMSAPVPAREVLFPLHAFNLEVARAPWVSAEPSIGLIRLQWWQDAMEEISDGGAARRHEVVDAVAALGPEVARGLVGVVKARRRDVSSDPLGSAAALWRYLEETGGALAWAAALALGASPAREAEVRRVGSAGGLARYLRAVPALEARGRKALPEGVVVPALAREGLERLAGWHRLRRRLGRPGAALNADWLAATILRQAARRPEAVSQGSLGVSPFRARLMALWL